MRTKVDPSSGGSLNMFASCISAQASKFTVVTSKDQLSLKAKPFPSRTGSPSVPSVDAVVVVGASVVVVSVVVVGFSSVTAGVSVVVVGVSSVTAETSVVEGAPLKGCGLVLHALTSRNKNRKK